jgi:putative membrane protein
MLFAASTWPIHQIGEDYLYSAHMLQHLMLSYFLPPLVLLATPEWLLRVLVGEGATYRVVRFFSRPVVAAVLFNGMVMITHIPGVVNGSTVNGPFHFLLHFMVVMTAVLAWMPVVGPLPELQMRHGGKMIYLFLFSVVPTVPAAWLAMAERPVYYHYGDQPVRVWNIDPINDQQVAGLIMKVGGGIFLWVVVIYMFFKRFGIEAPEANSYRRTPEPETTLTYDEVSAAFDASNAPADH